PLSNAAKKKTGAKARVSVGWCSGLAQGPPVGTGQCFVKAMAQIGPAIINFNQCQRNQSDTRFSFPSAAATRKNTNTTLSKSQTARTVFIMLPHRLQRSRVLSMKANS